MHLHSSQTLHKPFLTPLLDVASFMVCSAIPWRLELFFKSISELQTRVIPFIKEHGITHINLTNKVLGIRQKLQ